MNVKAEDEWCIPEVMAPPPPPPHVSPSSSATHQVCVIRLNCDNSCNSLVRRKVKHDTLGSLHTNALFKHFREDRWRATGAGRANVFPGTTVSECACSSTGRPELAVIRTAR